MNAIRRLTDPVQPRARLVCFPHAGGTASFFQSWRSWIPADTQSWAVQYPGRHDRMNEPRATSMALLLDDVLPELCRSEPLPTVLFGHSLGAAVAFECARRLPNPPALVILSARRGPGRPIEDLLADKSDADLIDGLARLGGIDPQILSNGELVELMLPILRADCKLSETYAPDPRHPIEVPLLVCVGDSDPAVSVDDILAWESATISAFAHRVYPGGHFYLRDHAAALVRAAVDATTTAGSQAAPVSVTGRMSWPTSR